MRRALLFIVGLLLWISCGQPKNTDFSLSSGAYYNMDSLLDAQIATLTSSEAILLKTFGNKDTLEQIVVDTDSSDWIRSLSAFRVIDLNKSSLKDEYTMVNHITDSSSNLSILLYRIKNLNSSLKLKEARFYYLNSIENLKKIVVKTESHGFVYNSTTTLQMIFDQSQKVTYLKKYSITTSQKTLFRDSINNHTDFEVKY